MRTLVESLLKRRFFVVHLLLSAVAAMLFAKTVTSLAGHMVLSTLSAKLPPPEKKVASRTSGRSFINRDFEGVADANIFEGKREVVVEGEAVETPQMPVGDGECGSSPKSGLRLRLVGTVVFTEPEYSFASIVDEGKGGAAEMFSINECQSMNLDPDDPDSKLAPKAPPCNHIGDSAMLRRVEAERVCIWNESEGHMEYLALNEPPEKGGAPKIAKTDDSPPSPTDDIGKDIKKVGENSYEVGQGEVDKALNNLSDLATQARVVPAFEGGKTIGFKLFSIRPGSLYSKIGLQNGDVITRINGYEMSSPEKGLEIYGKLKDSKQVTVDMKRRGKPMTLDYAITQ